MVNEALMGTDADVGFVRFLLESGADVEAKDELGRTPLGVAAESSENPELILMLLKAGADVEVKDDDGELPLDLAPKNKALQGTEALKALEAATNQ